MSSNFLGQIVNAVLLGGALAISSPGAGIPLANAQETGNSSHTHAEMAGPLVKAGSLEISGATARFTIPGRPGAAFMKIKNSGDTDRLVSASSPIAGRVEIHQSEMQDGVMKMRPVEMIEVPAKGAVELKSGGYHLMLMDVQEAPKIGEKVPLSLTFERAGTVELHATVQAPGAGHSH
jgi:copper(I)-binding protein